MGEDSRESLSWKGLWEIEGDHVNFNKAPLIADSTLKPPLCLPQSKPLIPLQKEEDPETHKTVLTNYMFPQQTRIEDCEYCALKKTAFLFYILSCLIWQMIKLQMFPTCFYTNQISATGLDCCFIRKYLKLIDVNFSFATMTTITICIVAIL